MKAANEVVVFMLKHRIKVKDTLLMLHKAMAQPKPHLLTRGDLRRINDCVVENNKLADCWKSEQVIIVAFEPAGAHLSDTCQLSLGILSPTTNTVRGSKNNEKHPTRRVCRKEIVVLERIKENKGLQPRPWLAAYDFREQIRDCGYRYQARTRAQEIFSELHVQYFTICIVSHDLRDSLSALKAFGVELHASAVHVDLIKVLEHQSRQSGKGTPEELRQYTDENVAVRNGRYDWRPRPLAGVFGMPNLALLEVLGPAAESHRRDKTEKVDATMRRIVRRMMVAGIPVRNKG